MAINKRKTETAGDVIDASSHQIHKAGNLIEMKIAAGLDAHTIFHSGGGSQNWKRYGALIMFITSAVLMLVSFLAYSQMLNVQESIDLLGPDLSYEQLVAMGREIARSSANWFYVSVASLVFAAVLLTMSLTLAFFRS